MGIGLQKATTASSQPANASAAATQLTLQRRNQNRGRRAPAITSHCNGAATVTAFGKPTAVLGALESVRSGL